MGEIIRYGVAGTFNTIVGYAIFILCYRIGRLAPEYANAAGYAVGLVLAFVLNRFFVFQGARATPVAAVRFAMSFLFAFGLNQVVLAGLINFGMLPEISQIAAMVSYTVSFYLLNKLFVFTAGQNHT